MFYLIGLGLEERSLNLEALEILKDCKKVYIETYTVEFPYKIHELEGIIGRIIPMTRMMIEDEKFLDEAKKMNIALLVYGSPLVATTHISLILKCKKENIPYKIFNNASILDAIAETGLQVYKFGKTASMPLWTKNYKPESFAEIISENRKIKAHTLILVDIGLTFSQALKQLKEACKNKKIALEKIIVCSKLGTNDSKIFYENQGELLGLEIYPPFCLILPSELHFIEEEALSLLSEKQE